MHDTGFMIKLDVWYRLYDTARNSEQQKNTEDTQYTQNRQMGNIYCVHMLDISVVSFSVRIGWILILASKRKVSCVHSRSFTFAAVLLFTAPLHIRTFSCRIYSRKMDSIDAENMTPTLKSFFIDICMISNGPFNAFIQNWYYTHLKG